MTAAFARRRSRRTQRTQHLQKNRYFRYGAECSTASAFQPRKDGVLCCPVRGFAAVYLSNIVDQTCIVANDADKGCGMAGLQCAP